MICKEWNEREGEQTELEPDLGFQNPAALSAKTYMLITHHEIDNPAQPGGLDTAFVKQQCMHCHEPACVSACPVSALQRQPEARSSTTPTSASAAATACWPAVGRADRGLELAARPRSASARSAPTASRSPCRSRSTGRRCPPPRASGSPHASRCPPACRRAPPTRSLRPATRCWRTRTSASPTGTASTSTTSAARRSRAARPCCTCRVPFEKLGFPTSARSRYPAFTKTALGAVPPAVIGVGALLGASYACSGSGRRRWRDAEAATTATSNSSRSGAKLDSLQLGPARCSWPSARSRSSRVSPWGSAAARTSPTPSRGACGSSSTSCGSRWRRARSRWRASSTSSSERISTGSAAAPSSSGC